MIRSSIFPIPDPKDKEERPFQKRDSHTIRKRAAISVPIRKQTIERDFGDCKENHCLRYTRIRGLKKNSHQAAIIFSVHNLKKLSLWRSKYKAYYDHIDEKEAERKKDPSYTASFS